MGTTTFKQAILFDAENRCWMKGINPVEAFSTDKIEDVQSLMESVEQRIHRGYTAIGFLSYEAAPAFDVSLQVHPASTNIPLAYFVVFKNIETLDELPEVDKSLANSVSWTKDIDSKKYRKKIEQIQQEIKEGNTYQVNFTYRLHADYQGDAYSFFYQLVNNQKADYAAFIDTADWAVCSASPEQFFEKTGSLMISRPMKGTIHRGRTLEEDETLKNWLYYSEKNRSENTMIVDMVRNDLGSISKTSSVRVKDYFKIEKYPTVWQMTSGVQAESGASIVEIMKGLFPPASITGTPKPETMKIIQSLESSPRGIYTGTIGFFNRERAQFNVAIRTAFINKKSQQLEYGVGGGIVWDSKPDEEWIETITKTKILSSSRPVFSILETLLFEPEKGFFLLEKHCKRMKNAALYFDFPYDEATLITQLNALRENLTDTSKVRVLLNEKGRFTLESVAISEAIEGNQFVVLANESVNSNDPFLYFKTTFRDVYDRFAKQQKGVFDVILWNEKGEVTEGTRSNLMIKQEGQWFTPPVNCGLLAGTYRQFLMETENIKEKILKKEDLFQAEEVVMFNSVRKKVSVRLK